MKQCPRCRLTYDDDELNFCLDDGELLTALVPAPTQFADDAPPTILLDQSRVTNPASWPASPPAAPAASWQRPAAQPFAPRLIRSADQTIPTIALVLGILSLPTVCCAGGLWLGIPAAVLGFIGMRNADSDSGRYGGRGMAVAGVVLGVVSFLATIVYWAFAILAR
jgi:Domain of unknown function (DUF4190)